MKTKKTVKKLRKLGYKYLAKLKPGKVIKVEVDGPVTAHFVKYKRLCHPVDPDVSVSKRPKVKEVQELYRKFTDVRQERDHYKQEATKLEDMLRRALMHGPSVGDGNRDGHAKVMNEYVRLQHDRAHAKDVGSWIGASWVDTNFIPKLSEGATPNDKSFSIDQTSVSLDQWGDLVHVTDVGRFKAKRKNKMAMKRAKR